MRMFNYVKIHNNKNQINLFFNDTIVAFIEDENIAKEIKENIDSLAESKVLNIIGKNRELENIIFSALADLKIDGHTERGIYNTIAILEKSAKQHVNRESLVDEIADEWMETLQIKSKDFGVTLNNTQEIVSFVIDKIYGEIT